MPFAFVQQGHEGVAEETKKKVKIVDLEKLVLWFAADESCSRVPIGRMHPEHSLFLGNYAYPNRVWLSSQQVSPCHVPLFLIVLERCLYGVPASLRVLESRASGSHPMIENSRSQFS